MQLADHGAEGRILPFVEATKALEVAEQLVRAVDEMNDHAALYDITRRGGFW